MNVVVVVVVACDGVRSLCVCVNDGGGGQVEESPGTVPRGDVTGCHIVYLPEPILSMPSMLNGFLPPHCFLLHLPQSVPSLQTGW